MRLVLNRIMLIAFYLVGVLSTTLGNTGMVTFGLVTLGVLALVVIEATLRITDQSKQDALYAKVRAIVLVLVAILVTAALFKLVWYFF